jgi:hypothetical protein
MAAIHEFTRGNVSVQRAMEFEDLVAAARILVRLHETEGLGIGLRWQWGIIPVIYGKKRTCVVCHGPWPCWRARWAASTLSTLDGVWREITGEDLASEYGYTAPEDEFVTIYQNEYQISLEDTPLGRRAG